MVLNFSLLMLCFDNDIFITILNINLVILNCIFKAEVQKNLATNFKLEKQMLALQTLKTIINYEFKILK